MRFFEVIFKRRQSGESGFTLVEIMVVVIIIGLLATVVGPRIFRQLGKAQEKVARQQIKDLEVACDLYRLDVGQYPSSLDQLINGSSPNWDGPYLKKDEIPVDPWGNPYQYRVVDGGEMVEISSTGGGKETITN